MAIIYKVMPDGVIHYFTLNALDVWSGLGDKGVQFHLSIAKDITYEAQLKYPYDKVAWVEC